MLFSIVTVCYNAEDFIEATILSVVNQTNCDYEYIIIDGASKDNTLKVIDRYRDRISKIVSEPDKGIYDAMNKGIRQAEGEYIIFMNAGDCFVDDDVLRYIAEGVCMKSGQNTVVYGDAIYRYMFGRRRVKAQPLKTIVHHMVFSHQSCFIRTDKARELMFDTSLLLASDYKMLLTLFVMGETFVYVDLPISIVDMDVGNTATKFNISAKETRTFKRELGFSWFHYTADYYYSLLRHKCVYSIKRHTPDWMLNLVVKNTKMVIY